MAFTDAQRARIRKLLGWGARFRSVDVGLENAMNSIELFPEDETQCTDILTELTEIDTLITAQREMLGVIQTGAVILTNDSGISGLKSEGRRLVDALASILRCEVRHNYYSGGSPKGGIRNYG